MVMTVFKQLALDLVLDDTYTFENYWPHANQELIDTIHHYFNTQFPLLLFITGGSSCGKTHILKATHEALKKMKKAVISFSMTDLIDITPNILDGIEQLDYIIIDDIDAIQNHPAWQEALFHCYNRSQDKQCRWIVSAKEAPNHLSMTLKDLQSRLSHGITFALKPHHDESKAKILQWRAKMLGLRLSDQVAYYLIQHYERDMHSQIQRLDFLEKASLATARKLTIPFIKEILSNQT
jgi:DnaA family protein